METKRNIFADKNIPLLGESLQALGNVTIYPGKGIDAARLAKEGCETLFTRSTIKVGPELLSGTRVNFTATATSGTDHVDRDWLAANSIAFASAPGSNANSVAEWVVYSLLKWCDFTNASPLGKTIGIIGYGNIGRIVAKYAGFMGMKVLVNDPPLLDDGFNFPGSISYAAIDEIFDYSDAVTNHVPLYEAGVYKTKGLIDTERIALMHPGALLLHASRGGVAEEVAMIARLGKKEIYAAVDVWKGEPCFSGELANLALIASPHVAGHSYDGKIRGTIAMLDAYGNFYEEEPDRSFVNGEMASYAPMEEQKFRNEQYIYDTLRGAREFEDDFRRMRELSALSPDERSAGFFEMRKSYPVRRESL